MIFFDILVYLAVAKIAVLLFEDAAYAARGKQSPRRQARARQQAAQKAEGSAGASAPAGPGRAGGAVAAADGYLAGLIEDATERARARRRRAMARKSGAQAVDGVVVDVDDDGRWYADCDVCGWASRPYRIEANAQGAGREHTRTVHPEQYTGPEPTPSADSAESAAAAAGDRASSDEEPRRPALRVIPGGAQDAADPAPAATAGEPVSGDRGEPAPGVVHTDQHPYCLTPCGPTCTAPRPRPRFGWRCRVCGQHDESFTSMQDAEAAGAKHTCPPKPPVSQPSAATAAGPDPVGPPTQADVERIRNDLYGRCAYREVSEGLPDQWCDNPGGGPQGPFCDEHKSTGADAGDEQHHPAADPAAGTSSSTEQLRELTVNLEATGPEEIRAAFTQAAESAGEQAEQIGGIAGVLTEAADRYEGLDMAASTVGHLRGAAEQFAAAHVALGSAQEELQAALGDFNSKDGQVAEAVADAGGNVASKEVLVG
ncbi:hypothetical protein AB0H28_26900 [Micromonospora sp. NPDC050980]|uniref:hypothetical protein n=1 Tax=Micromonospora sp. NPDC050980 TaxID=3155161 RepID=UPI0033D339B2